MPKYKEKKIGLDIDGVTEDVISPGLDGMNLMLGTDYKYGEVTNWDFFHDETLRQTGNHKLADFIQGLLFDSEIVGQAKPYPGAQLALAILRGLGEDINFITTRRPVNREATLENFQKYFPWAVEEGRIQMRTVGNSEAEGFKRGTIAKMGIKEFYEDNARTVRAVPVANLVDQPWNQGDTDLEDKRVRHGWLGILLNELKG